jgi:uncharacterized membrane protein YhhN
MKSKIWLILFVADAILNVLSDYFQWNEIRFVTKPLLTIILFIYCLSEVREKNKFIFLLLSALIFSCLGDVFLLFEKSAPYWFIFGLTSFLIAHIFYIILFLQIKKKNQAAKKLNWIITLLISSYTIFLFLLLKPSLADLKIPVLIYASALSIMLLSSVHAFDLSKQIFGKLCVTGAIFFLASDSLLAINKFYKPFVAAGFVIMFTYAAAQLLIVLGITRYFNSINKN